MVEYVLCYAQELHQIVFVRKTKPAWQSGLLNLPGGHVEPGETPAEAARRELQEETGLVTKDTYYFGRLEGPGYVVHCVYCMALRRQKPGGCEKVVLLTEGEFCNRPDVIPNLKIVIPLMRAGVANWTIRGEKAGELETSWQVFFG